MTKEVDEIDSDELAEVFESKLVAAPREKRKPSDLLLERGSFLRRFAGRQDPPTIDALQKHASKFGSEAVPETAAELGYGLDACTRLIEHCDRADAAIHLSQTGRKLNAKNGPAEKRARVLLGLEDETPEDPA